MVSLGLIGQIKAADRCKTKYVGGDRRVRNTFEVILTGNKVL